MLLSVGGLRVGLRSGDEEPAFDSMSSWPSPSDVSFPVPGLPAFSPGPAP